MSERSLCIGGAFGAEHVSGDGRFIEVPKLPVSEARVVPDGRCLALPGSTNARRRRAAAVGALAPCEAEDL